MNNIAIIGAGPAGVMAAHWAGKNNKVTIFDKNEKLGKKLFLTGKGRCNLTNNRDISEYFNYVVRNKNFLYSALYSFSNLETINFFENQGLSTKVERGDRVFPKSDKSSDVIKALRKSLDNPNIKISLNEEVKNIYKENEEFIILTNKGNYKFSKVIIATGGLSYSSTGSTGDGYFFAKKMGHKVVDLKPGLIPILLRGDKYKGLQGLTLKNIMLKCLTDRKVYEEFGELLFTHDGISGPTALTMSSYINRFNKINLFLDLKPALSKDQLDKRIISDFQKHNNKNLGNALKDLLPKSIIPLVITCANLEENQVVNQITREERQSLIENMKNLPLDYDGLMDINAAIITSGGIDVKDLNPSTMESKIVKGLYFCGEVIDVDALTGGYNLQIAFSTGYLAGTNV